MLYADDLVLIAESEDKLMGKLRVWKKGFTIQYNKNLYMPYVASESECAF